jgi:hypothetical protein
MYGNEFEDFAELEGMLEGMLEGVDVEFLAGIALVVGVIGLIAAVLGLVFYVLKSLGMYTIAKRRGINNPWLAWLPVGNEWIAGSISDQYRYVAKGQVTNRRIIMLALSIAAFVLSGISSSVSMGSFAQMMEGAMMGNEDMIMQASGTGAVTSLISLLNSGVSIATIVFWYMSMYDLYSSTNPGSNVVMLVLSIFFGFLEPFFIFCNRNKDDGMPARTVEPEQPVWQEPQLAQPDYQYNRVEGDPWDNNTEN